MQIQQDFCLIFSFLCCHPLFHGGVRILTSKWSLLMCFFTSLLYLLEYGEKLFLMWCLCLQECVSRSCCQPSIMPSDIPRPSAFSLLRCPFSLHALCSLGWLRSEPSCPPFHPQVLPPRPTHPPRSSPGAADVPFMARSWGTLTPIKPLSTLFTFWDLEECVLGRGSVLLAAGQTHTPGL